MMKSKDWKKKVPVQISLATYEKTVDMLIRVTKIMKRVRRLADVWEETGKLNDTYRLFAEDLNAVLKGEQPPNTGDVS